MRYPSRSGGWQLGDLDLREHLAKYKDHEIVVIVASPGKAGKVEKKKYACGICGFAMDELGECPRCKLQRERTAKGFLHLHLLVGPAKWLANEGQTEQAAELAALARHHPASVEETRDKTGLLLDDLRADLPSVLR
jgi:hypothetical protein